MANSREWQLALQNDNNAQAEVAFSENRKTFDGYHSLVEQDRMARQQRKRAADNALASMLIEARNSGNGMVPASMCAAVSQDCGMDIAGGVLTKDGNLHLLTHDQNGGIVEFPNGSGVINPANQFGVLQRTGLGIDLQKELYDGFCRKYTPKQLAKVGITKPIDTLRRDGVLSVGGTATMGSGALKNSENVNITTGERSDSGARPGPRQRFISQDDIDGRPYKDPSRPGERYLGHGISSFSTTDFQEDRENARNPGGRWVETAVGPSDTFDGKTDKTQVRTYKNTKTGEVVRVKDGETPPWRKQTTETTDKGKTGAGVEIAKINAASREKVAGMNNGSRERIADGNNQTRREISGAQIASREKIAEAANVLKELGINVSAELKERGYDLQEERDAETARHNKAGEELAGKKAGETERHNKAGEGIAGSRQREQERHNREQERLRGKSVEERERHNRAGEATADRRVEDQYELGDRKQTHNENRLENDKEKAARIAGQRDAELEEKKREFDTRESRLSKPKVQGGSGSGDDGRKAVAAMKGMLELARSSGMSEDDLADLESWTNERIKGMAGLGDGQTSGNGGAKGKVKYTDLKPGDVFMHKGRKCIKTEKGYRFAE